jgi:hypothetical protein
MCVRLHQRPIAASIGALIGAAICSYMINHAHPAWAEQQDDNTSFRYFQYQKNPFNPANKYDPANPWLKKHRYMPGSPLNPANRYDIENPLNPANRYRTDNPFNPLNRYDPESPLSPANRFNPYAPLKKGDGPLLPP